MYCRVKWLSTETSVDSHFTRQYIPEDNSEHHTRRREILKSHLDKKKVKILPEFPDVSGDWDFGSSRRRVWRWHLSGVHCYLRFGEGLLPFNSECVVFLPVIEKRDSKDLKNRNFPGYLYGCETWSLTLREENSLKRLITGCREHLGLDGLDVSV
jgi:hypothetical protein